MTSAPTIDYTDKDFQSLRQAMLNLARYRMPEWTDRSPADLGNLLIDLFAYMGDVILYYQDRIANESFLQTAVERRSVLNALNLIGYQLAPPVAASADLTLTFKAPPQGASTVVTVPAGARFSTTGSTGAPPQMFEYLGDDLSIDLASDQVAQGPGGKTRIYAGLPVTQCVAQPTTIIGGSTGEPNQSFMLPSAPVVLSTLVVEVNEGAGWVAWSRVDSLLYQTAGDGRILLSNAEDRDYYVTFDENDFCWICFGDGTYGRIPPTGGGNIRATWRVGGGAAGNAPVDSIVKTLGAIPLLSSVTNPAAAAGGADHESIDHARAFGPLAFRSCQRAVTLSDYVALAQQAGGVAKVRAAAPNWNNVELYVAPAGEVATTVPESLRRYLMSYFEDKRMAGVFVKILDATYIPIDISVEVVFDARFQSAAVRQAVENALNGLLAFNNVDFGQALYLSDVYGAVEVLPGVTAVTVTEFRRHDSPAAHFSDAAISAAANAALLTLPAGAPRIDLGALLRRAMQIDVAPDGRLELRQYEIPAPGAIEIVMLEANS